MSKLTDLDPRLAGWDDLSPEWHGCCDLCGVSGESAVVDEYSSGYFCDDCACGPVQPSAPVVMPARPEGYYHAKIGTFD